MTFGVKIQLESSDIEKAIKDYLVKRGYVIVCSEPTHIVFFTEYGQVKTDTLTAVATQTRII